MVCASTEVVSVSVDMSSPSTSSSSELWIKEIHVNTRGEMYSITNT